MRGELPVGPSRGNDDLDGHICRPTVVFADIQDFTPLTHEFSDDVVAALVGERLRAVGFEIFKAYGCEYREFRGDELMACFGVRTEVEAAPLRACRAAWELHQRMLDEIGALVERFGVRPRLRIGVHTGGALYWESENDVGEPGLHVHGDALNVGKRVESVTEPDRVYIGSETYHAVKEFFEAPSVGEFQLKGVSEPLEIFRLDGVREDVSRFDARASHGLTKLLERADQLVELEAVVESSSRNGLTIVEVVGEPGIGKSRLVHELELAVDRERATFFLGHCRIDGRNAPFHPFVEVLCHRNGFNIAESDGDETVRAKLERVLGDVLDLDPNRHIPYLMNLLGRASSAEGFSDSAEVVGAETRNTLTRLLTHRAAVSPVVLVIEDLHWIDTTSEALMRSITESATQLPIVIVCTFRVREYTPTWGTTATIRRFALDPLSAEGTNALVRQRLAVDAIPSELIDYVMEMSEGNPLFAEEIVSYLVDSERLAVRGDSVVFERRRMRPDLPEQPRELFQQRLGRLDPETRKVIEAASVVGRQFAQTLVGNVCGLDSSVVDHLDSLTKQELIRLTDRDQRRYTFKHSLIQEAAYAALTRTRREQLHAAVGGSLAELYRGREGEVADVLAYHYGQAYDLANRRPKMEDGTRRANPHSSHALRHLKAAGEKSLRLYSAEDAHERLQRALGIANEDSAPVAPETVASLVLSLARIHYFHGDVTESVRLLEQHLELARECPVLLPSYLAELGHGYVYSFRAEEAGRTLIEAERLALESEDLPALGRAKMGLVWRHVFCVPPEPAQRREVEILGREADALGESAGDAWLRVTAKFAMAQDAVMHANPRRIQRFAEELLALHEAHDDTRAKSLAAVVLAEMHALNMNYDEAIANANAARQLAVTEIDQFNVRCAEGVAAAMAERGPEAVQILGPLRAELVRRGVRIAQLLIDMPLGVARIAVGDLAAGVRIIKGAIDEFGRWGYPMGQCNGHSFLGELYTRVALKEDTLSFKDVLKNILFIVTTVPFASKKARYHLRCAAACNEYYDAPSYVAWAYLNLGRLDLAENKLESARSILRKACDIAHGVDAFALSAAALLNLGQLAEQEQDFERARDQYERANEDSGRSGAHVLAARSLLSLAALARRAHRVQEARSLYVKAREKALPLGSKTAAALVGRIDQELSELA